MKTILAPIDFSPATPQVLDAATALAVAMGARLVLLHVLAPPVLPVDDQGATDLLAELTHRAGIAATQKLVRLQRSLADDGVTVTGRQRTGLPAVEIAAEARELKADFLVIGSHGHGSFLDPLAGNTTRRVLKRTPCPVLVVPISRHRKPHTNHDTPAANRFSRRPALARGRSPDSGRGPQA